MTTNQNLTNTVSIFDGPSFASIVDAFKYAYDKEFSMRSKFTIEGKNCFEMQVVSIEHEDGSNSSLNMSGFISYKGVRIVKPIRVYYNTKTRSGCLIFDEASQYDYFMTTHEHFKQFPWNLGQYKF